MIEFVEGQPVPPKVILADACDCFLGQGLGFAGITGGINQKAGLGLVQEFEEDFKTGVVDSLPRMRSERPAAMTQFFFKGLPHKTRSAQEKNHEVNENAELRRRPRFAGNPDIRSRASRKPVPAVA